jgi:hypothetical protein
MTPNQQTEKAATPRSPVFTTALMIYGTLFLLVASMPGSVVSWLQGLNTNPVQQRALHAAQAMQVVSDRIGLSAPFLRARAVFLEETEDH